MCNIFIIGGYDLSIYLIMYTYKLCFAIWKCIRSLSISLKNQHTHPFSGECSWPYVLDKTSNKVIRESNHFKISNRTA